MSETFAALILTHRRPDRVFTLSTLRAAGYTGRVVLVVDDADPTLDAYRSRFETEPGVEVATFSKADVGRRIDAGDNSGDTRGILWARNASFDVAASLGLDAFVQLDDDYTSWYYRFNEAREYGGWQIRNLDNLFGWLVDYLRATPFASVALSQGGDHIGGGGTQRTIRTKRKAMNSFVCLTARRFEFVGRINEDVNAYTAGQRAGTLFLTVLAAQLNQVQTQAGAGGMTDLYLDSGTYVKSFFSVMYAPSAVIVSPMGGHRRTLDGQASRVAPRLHHRVEWNAVAPKILPETFRKPRA